MSDLGPVIHAVLPVFILSILGFVLRRAEWLTEEADESLMRVVINVLTPCLIFDKILGNHALTHPGNWLVPPMAGFGGVALGIGLAWLFRHHVGASGESAARTFAFAVGHQNYGYFPLPLILALFPGDTAGILFIHNLGVDLAMWTLGLITLGHASGVREWKKLLNPPIVAIFSALILNVVQAGTWMPRFAIETSSMLGACTFPLGLILIGATMSDFAKDFRPWNQLQLMSAACLLRLAIIPLGLLMAAKYIPFTRELREVLAVQAAMPAAVFPIILARHYGGDPLTALRVVIATSTLGLLTMPLTLRLALNWLGLATRQ